MTPQQDLISTARKAGLSYLALAISGVIGFLWLHPQIFASSDIEKTIANLTEKETLARVRLLFEITIVAAQALAAVYFFKLFKDINPFASWALGAWGMMNAGLIMMSAIAMGGAIEVAHADLASADKVMLVRLFVQLIRHAWGVGGLFFGLWLIPMGYIVVSSQRLPVWLGRVLILGGIGYIVNTYLSYFGVESNWVNLLTLPATVGEFWMVGYLLVFGIRPDQNQKN